MERIPELFLTLGFMAKMTVQRNCAAVQSITHASIRNHSEPKKARARISQFFPELSRRVPRLYHFDLEISRFVPECASDAPCGLHALSGPPTHV